eukprot:CAMPEP_0206036392 /NCGR_PEP_ID=MMETSP1466-20131121/2735_1 /ASSEMBLY_ACC=CAM_ASM_001126 /TAXON_ID=44452 /ORGANISM="Pavlova gyrans, Strain CCMP608" /LENGTH=106 /DNA_ID=CAMNT_0053410857 /DNA_START=359 /DNA_END=679 /DNA_ORIENTATION=+
MVALGNALLTALEEPGCARPFLSQDRNVFVDVILCICVEGQCSLPVCNGFALALTSILEPRTDLALRDVEHVGKDPHNRRIDVAVVMEDFLEESSLQLRRVPSARL